MTSLAKADVFERLGHTWWDGDSAFSQMADFNPLRLAYIVEVAGPLNGQKILDIGCGGGLLCEALAQNGADVYGVDRSVSAIQAARCHVEERALSIDYRAADAASLPFSDSSFDFIIASEVFEHVEDVGTVLHEAARVLKPRGRLIFDTPNRTWLARLLLIGIGEYVLQNIPRGTHDGARFLRPSELAAMLLKAGLSLKHLRGFSVRGRLPRGPWQFRFSPSLAFAYFGWADHL